MRALTLGDDGRFEVRDVPDPQPAPDEVVLRVAACGICGSDLHMVEAGVIPPAAILGHEASGVVESVGEAVEDLAPGTPVAVHPFDPCGSCENCRSGATQRCADVATSTIGLGSRPGAFAERLRVRPGMLYPLPDGFPVELGALAEPLAVALHGFRRADFEPGMDVGVVGCGPIGLCSVLVARALGAGHIWASDPNDFRAELASRVGADAAGRSTGAADLVLECAGAPGTIDLAVQSARSGGQVVILAVNMKGDTVFPFTWVTKETDIIPCLGYTKREYDEAATMIAAGTVDVAQLVTKRTSLDETDEAFFGLLEGAPEGKVLVVPNS